MVRQGGERDLLSSFGDKRSRGNADREIISTHEQGKGDSRPSEDSDVLPKKDGRHKRRTAEKILDRKRVLLTGETEWVGHQPGL